mmetsp:Transcript_14558/g.34862  ORF Transcript_14558/g.34862 Transcript_14558/m.34862 type:complete len:213 (+) Transcript_14558:207-845(+)
MRRRSAAAARPRRNGRRRNYGSSYASRESAWRPERTRTRMMACAIVAVITKTVMRRSTTTTNVMMSVTAPSVACVITLCSCRCLAAEWAAYRHRSSWLCLAVGWEACPSAWVAIPLDPAWAASMTTTRKASLEVALTMPGKSARSSVAKRRMRSRPRFWAFRSMPMPRRSRPSIAVLPSSITQTSGARTASTACRRKTLRSTSRGSSRLMII